ncbi:MAG TPA: hypothetical protein VI893_04630 [Thermoplasmata archaeon]|nr:hypothetical protein [Thermoplasmata archaeon]
MASSKATPDEATMSTVHPVSIKALNSRCLVEPLIRSFRTVLTSGGSSET